MIALAGAGAIAFFTIYDGAPQPTPVGLAASRLTDEWIAALREHAEDGYWIVVRGTHIGDQAVAAGSAAQLTHAAVYDRERDEIIEAVGTGVTRTPLRELIAQSWRVQLIEPRDQLVRAAGMRYVHIPLESTDAPEPEEVAQFLEVARDPEAHPIYVHCLHGVDRTGAMIALYRMQEQGWSNSDALAEMEHFGAHGILHDLRRFVGSFVPRR